MQFFIATPLGFEESVCEEIKAVWPRLLNKSAQPLTEPLTELKVLKGGVELECDFFVGLQFNFFLKTANRVLLRLAQFKAKDFPSFYGRFKVLPWKDYFHSSAIQFSVAAQTSRLNNEKRIQESAQAALDEIFGKNESEELQDGIFIRFENDLCTISLDTTGEHLHKRGWGQLKGEAPLRETLAAKMLQELLKSAPEAGDEIVLMDPMMGSGTFLSEAMGWAAGHFSRAYAFQAWKRAPKLFQADKFYLNYKSFPKNPFKELYGMDLSEKMQKSAEKNLQQVAEALVQQRAPTAPAFKVFQGDALKGHENLPQGAWLVVNPPYGERIEQSSESLRSLIEGLIAVYSPQKMGLLFPRSGGKVKAPKGYRLQEQVSISNGGIPCLFNIFTLM